LVVYRQFTNECGRLPRIQLGGSQVGDDLGPPHNFIAGWFGLDTSHQLLVYLLDYQGFESFKK